MSFDIDLVGYEIILLTAPCGFFSFSETEVSCSHNGAISMPCLFNEWCNGRNLPVGSHQLVSLNEKAGVRAGMLPILAATVASHYDEPQRLIDRIGRIGYQKTAAHLASILPQTKKARSGDMGEILATEAVPEFLRPFRVPIKRLRWKDAREQAMRGEDLIAVDIAAQPVRFIKGESKSRLALAPGVIGEARAALNSNDGRPSQHAMSFIMNRLFESGEEALALIFEDYLLNRRIPLQQLMHLIFTLSGNDATVAHTDDLAACDGTVERRTIALRIEDHQEFIASVFDEVTHA